MNVRRLSSFHIGVDIGYIRSTASPKRSPKSWWGLQFTLLFAILIVISTNLLLWSVLISVMIFPMLFFLTITLGIFLTMFLFTFDYRATSWPTFGLSFCIKVTLLFDRLKRRSEKFCFFVLSLLFIRQIYVINQSKPNKYLKFAATAVLEKHFDVLSFYFWGINTLIAWFLSYIHTHQSFIVQQVKFLLHKYLKTIVSSIHNFTSPSPKLQNTRRTGYGNEKCVDKTFVPLRLEREIALSGSSTDYWPLIS